MAGFYLVILAGSLTGGDIFLTEYLTGHENIENILRQRSLNFKISSSPSTILNSRFGRRVLKHL